MDSNKGIKEELEGRIKKLEDYIKKRDLGSRQLVKARKAQRKISAGIFIGSLLTVAGITLWVINSDKD